MSDPSSEPERRDLPAEEGPPLPLFRAEALAARQGPWTGAIRLSQTTSHWVLATLALMLGIGIAAFITFGSYTRKMQVTGIVTPVNESVNIASPNAGVLVRNLVREGARVTRGQPLFEIASGQHGGTGALSVQSSVRQQTLDAERRARIDRQSKPQRDVDARLAHVTAEHERIEQELASIRQEMARRESGTHILIKAPEDGVLTTIANDPGQSMAAGQVLATLLPGGAISERAGKLLEAHLYAPSEMIGFVQVGQPVMIRYRAFPYQKFGLYHGTVSAIGRTPLAPNELPNNTPAARVNEGLYRVKVALARQSVAVSGREQPLTAGMTLEADLVLDRRSIGEWIFEPMIALAKR